MTLDLNEQLLVAMPSMGDPRFEQAVIFICSYDPAQGAMGLVINQPLKLSAAELFQHMDVEINDASLSDQQVMLGGPLGEQQGFLLRIVGSLEHPMPEWSLSTSKQELLKLAEGDGPENVLIFLGYCSWAAGQLENELKQNAWLVTPASAKLVFATPFAERWRSAAALVGVDFNRMTNIGHA